MDDDGDNVKIISTHDEKAKVVGEILSNDTSRKILNLLSVSNEMTLNQISQETGLSLSLVTHHLKKMQSVQVVVISKVGRSVKGHKMNYYSATNQSFLITPSQEPVKSIKTSLKKFSKFVAIGMAGLVSWMNLRPENDAHFQGGESSPGTPEIINEREDKWESAYQSKSDEDMVVTGEFSGREESENQSLEPIAEPVSSEPKPSHSGVVEFDDFSEDSTKLDDTVRQNTDSISLDSEAYPVSYSSEASYTVDIDPLFLSIAIPIMIIVSGIILERILTRWYNRKKIKKIN
ncbi:winged helix-turn-helix domain-containing protein [archaeon]|nr:winged helix-turn-helix domain-containing protein [archaeon]